MSESLAYYAAITGTAKVTDAYNRGRIADAEASVQRQILGTNAGMARLTAQDILRRGDREAFLMALKTGEIQGMQRAAFAAGGVEVGTGSAGLAEAETARIGLEHQATIRENAFKEAWGLKAQANEYDLQSMSIRLANRRNQKYTLLTEGANAARGIATAAYFDQKYAKLPKGEDTRSELDKAVWYLEDR